MGASQCSELVSQSQLVAAQFCITQPPLTVSRIKSQRLLLPACCVGWEQNGMEYANVIQLTPRGGF